MTSLVWIVGIGVAVIIILVGVMFLPWQSRKRRKRRELRAQTKTKKDWEAIALRRENYIHRLKDEIARFLREQKQKEAEAAAFKDRVTKLQEKLKLEHQWREKEKDAVDKNAKRVQQLKEDLMAAEQSLGKEHSTNIRLNRELETLAREVAILKKEKMDRTLEVARFKALSERLEKELTQQKKLNEELIRQKEDVQWVAKSDFDKLQQLLKEKEKELERVSRQREPGG